MFGIQPQATLRTKETEQYRNVLLVKLARIIKKLFIIDFVEGYLDRTVKNSALFSKYL